MDRRFGALFAIGEILRLINGGTGYWAAWGYLLLIGVTSGIVAILPGVLLGSIAKLPGMELIAASAQLVSAYIGSLVLWIGFYLTLMAQGHMLGQWAAKAFNATIFEGMPPAAPMHPPTSPHAGR